MHSAAPATDTPILRPWLPGLQKLVRADVRISSNVLAFSGYTAFNTNDNGLKALALVVKVGSAGAGAGACHKAMVPGAAAHTHVAASL